MRARQEHDLLRRLHGSGLAQHHGSTTVGLDLACWLFTRRIAR
jgi:hypothetical protein